MDTNAATTSLNPWWRKVTALRKYLAQYDWVLFMDGDTLITNYTVPLQWFLPKPNDDIELIVTDHNIALNNGVFFMRNSPWSHKSVDVPAEFVVAVFRFCVFTSKILHQKNGSFWKNSDVFFHIPET